jgi:hypothetical protein
MNAVRTVLFAGVLIGAHAVAGATEPVEPLDFDCPLNVLPSQRAVGRVLGLDNFWQTYRARDRMMERVRAACAQGAVAVRVLPDDRAPTRLTPLVVALR